MVAMVMTGPAVSWMGPLGQLAICAVLLGAMWQMGKRLLIALAIALVLAAGVARAADPVTADEDVIYELPAWYCESPMGWIDPFCW